MTQEIVTGGETLIERVRGSVDGRYHAAEVSFRVEEGKPVLVGVVTSASLLESLRDSLARERIDAECRVKVCPGDETGSRVRIANTAVAGLHKRPDYRSALLTQILLGEEVRLITRSKQWNLVRVPDGYLGWTHDSGLTEDMEASGRSEGEEETVVVRAVSDLVRRSPSTESETVREVLYDSPLSRITTDEGWTRVRLPDGVDGWIPDVSLRQPIDDKRTQTADRIVHEATRMIGIPYLWGGSSTKGFDCSGLIQRVFHYCGVPLPRDSDLQRNTAAHLPAGCDPEPGDLLFFGEEKIDHVALALGGPLFLHASGWVRIESLDPASELYRADLAGRYKGAGRVPISGNREKKVLCPDR